MKYKEYKCNSYNVYTVKTNRFKTSHIELIFRGEVKKDLLPELVFLADVLSESSKNYPSKRSLMIRFEELYKISCYATSLRIGSTMDFHVSLDLINPKYINDADYLENAIKTLFEIVLNPNVENEEFDTVIFNNVKTRLYREIKSLEENDMKQSIKKAFKLMDSDSITSYDLLGTKEQLDEITPASLYKTYKNLLKNFSSDIFAIGDMDMDSLVKLIRKYYKNRYINEFTYNYYVDNKVRNSVKKGEEIGSSVQANLVMLFNLDNLEKRERDITMHVFNYLFGSGGLTSKLYRSIREKYSLCYNINSLYLKYDKLLLVHTSLENKNVLKAINLAKKDFKSMQHGEFTTEELNDAISNMLVSIDMSSDNNISIINNYVFKVYDNLPDLDERKKLFKEVTKSDVINVAKKIKLNTIFVLKGKGE